jgi:hypothetical protein
VLDGQNVIYISPLHASKLTNISWCKDTIWKMIMNRTLCFISWGIQMRSRYLTWIFVCTSPRR